MMRALLWASIAAIMFGISFALTPTHITLDGLGGSPRSVTCGLNVFDESINLAYDQSVAIVGPPVTQREANQIEQAVASVCNRATGEAVAWSFGAILLGLIGTVTAAVQLRRRVARVAVANMPHGK